MTRLDRGTRRTREDGASSVEYGLLAVLIAAVIVVAVFTLGQVTDGMFSSTCSEMTSAASSTATCS